MGNNTGLFAERFREVLWTLEQISWCIRMRHNLIDALAKALKGISIAQLGPAMYKSSMKKFIKIYILLIINRSYAFYIILLK
jgi:hypothetical protein